MKKSILTAVFLLSASVSHALAADLSAPTYTKAPVLAAPAYNWSGFYAGLHGGYGWGRSPTTVTPDPTDANRIVDPTGFTYAPTPDTTRIAGAFGGGQIGYNFVQSNLLAGIEVDISYAGWRSSGAATGPAFIGGIFNTAVQTKLDWDGTLRGRLGWLATPSLLVYGTAGLAYGSVKTTVTGTNLGGASCDGSHVYCFSGSTGGVSLGWTAGAGVEVAVGQDWSVKAEYLHIDLGSRSITVADNFIGGGFETIRNTFSADSVQVGVNYHIH